MLFTTLSPSPSFLFIRFDGLPPRKLRVNTGCLWQRRTNTAMPGRNVFDSERRQVPFRYSFFLYVIHRSIYILKRWLHDLGCIVRRKKPLGVFIQTAETFSFFSKGPLYNHQLFEEEKRRIMPRICLIACSVHRQRLMWYRISGSSAFMLVVLFFLFRCRLWCWLLLMAL